MSTTIISKEPWPEKGIQNYRSTSDGRWGYLILYSDLTFEFELPQSPSSPSESEILKRWGSYLAMNRTLDTPSLPNTPASEKSL